MSIHALCAAFDLKGLSSSEKLVMLSLANYADEHGRCWPSQRRLSEMTGLSDRWIRNVLIALEQKGLVVREKRHREDGSLASDMFILRFPRAEETSGGAEVSSGGVRKSVPGGAEVSSGHEPVIDTSLGTIGGERARGCRLPDDFAPDLRWAADELGDLGEAERELEKFRDYWSAQPGARGRKLDWTATWRNWVRRAAEDRRRRGGDGKRKHGAFAAVEFFRRAEGRDE